MAQWRNTLLIGYFAIIGATFAARAVRNAIERGRTTPDLDFVSGAHRAGAARLVGAGSEPQLPHPPRLDVRRPGALLHLPGAGDGRRGRLPGCRAGGARNPGSDRRAARRAARLSVAAGGRHFRHPADADRAADLPAAAAAAQSRARDRRRVLRLPQPRRAGERSHAAGPAVSADALSRCNRQRDPPGRRHAELRPARQRLRAVRPRMRPCTGRAPGAAGGRRHRARDHRPQRAGSAGRATARSRSRSAFMPGPPRSARSARPIRRR